MKLFVKTAFAAAVLAFVAGPALAASGVAKVVATSTSSKVSGDIKFTDTPKGLQLSGTITGLTPGLHAFHVHEFGDCSDGGKAAGGHYNPKNHPHGNVLKDGSSKAHAGDMGNLEADAQGTAKVDLTIPDLQLTGAGSSAAGRSVVIHEKADDFGQPTGNAGGRPGCGTIIITAH